MKNIPHIIHQVWSGLDGPCPSIFEQYKETWLRDYPSWEHILWNHQKMNEFIIENFPQFLEKYNEFPYNIQRWDVIRYLILYKYGGMYADLDYESLKPLDGLLTDQTCCFAGEDIFLDNKGKSLQYINNALMLSAPQHNFIKKIIETVFLNIITEQSGAPKMQYILNTTGPLMLTRLYHSLSRYKKKGGFYHAYKRCYSYIIQFSRSVKNRKCKT